MKRAKDTTPRGGNASGITPPRFNQLENLKCAIRRTEAALEAIALRERAFVASPNRPGTGIRAPLMPISPQRIHELMERKIYLQTKLRELLQELTLRFPSEVPQTHQFASRVQPKASPSASAASEMVAAASAKPAKTALVLGKYRSEVKRQIVIQLARNPKATDLDICRGLDADGSVEIPAGWQAKPGDRLYADAYMNPSGRTKIQVMISKIRKDLRNGALL